LRNGSTAFFRSVLGHWSSYLQSISARSTPRSRRHPAWHRRPNLDGHERVIFPAACLLAPPEQL